MYVSITFKALCALIKLLNDLKVIFQRCSMTQKYEIARLHRRFVIEFNRTLSNAAVVSASCYIDEFASTGLIVDMVVSSSGRCIWCAQIRYIT